MVGEIIVLSHDKVGITNNILGLANVISDNINAPVRLRKIKLRSHKLLPALRLITNNFDPDRSKKVLRYFRFFFIDEDRAGPPQNPICIIGTQANREVPCIFLSRALDCPAIYFGPVERLSENFFDVIIDHEGSQFAAKKAIMIPIVPSAIMLRDYSALSRPGCLLVIGGPIKHQHDDISFWTRLVDKSLEISCALSKSLAITTSPRTGGHIEKLITQHIVSRNIVAQPYVQYAAGDRFSVKKLLSNADLVIVSADSATMISEGIASGAHVIAAYHKSIYGSEKSRAFVEFQAKVGRITLWNIDHPAPLPLTKPTPLTECWSETLWRKIKLEFDAQAMKATSVAIASK
jgi:mitochondrial fission protein ELM1